jgi:hypothetical protein
MAPPGYHVKLIALGRGSTRYYRAYALPPAAELVTSLPNRDCQLCNLPQDWMGWAEEDWEVTVLYSGPAMPVKVAL